MLTISQSNQITRSVIASETSRQYMMDLVIAVQIAGLCSLDNIVVPPLIL